MVSDIPARDGKTAMFFYSVNEGYRYKEEPKEDEYLGEQKEEEDQQKGRRISRI